MGFRIKSGMTKRLEISVNLYAKDFGLNSSFYLVYPEGDVFLFGFECCTSSVTRVDREVSFDLQGFLQTFDHLFAAGVGEVPPSDRLLKKKVPAEPYIAYLDHRTARCVAGEVAEPDLDPLQLDLFISVDENIRMAWRCSLGEGIVRQHKRITFWAVDRKVQPLLHLGIAPDVVEMAVCVEDRHGMGDVVEYPAGGTDTGVDDEVFPLYCGDIAVGLVGAHGLHFDLHVIILLMNTQNNHFYHLLETAIRSDDIVLKEQLVAQCLEYCNQNSVSLPQDFIPAVFESPSYASRCRIVNPRDLPARKEFDTSEGLATLVHAIAHIEYSAIDLALDAVYRFPQMPPEYKRDWLVVAEDEIRHYKMLLDLLDDLGYAYGDFPVHCGLFDAAAHTADALLDRMAVVPRYYEASGLDVNPQIIKKLENRRKNPLVAKLIAALNVIYEEEIEHVHKGDKWFKHLCARQGLDESVYFEILERYKLMGKHRPHINVDARKEAGFTCNEIKKLGAKTCE